jgi:hypothetical protein
MGTRNGYTERDYATNVIVSCWRWSLLETNDKDVVGPLGEYEFLFIDVVYLKGGC